MSDVMMWKPAEEREAKRNSKATRKDRKKEVQRGASRKTAEVQTRNLKPHFIRGGMVALVLLLAIGGYVWMQHQQWENFKVRTIEITGSHEFVTSEQVSSALQQYAEGDFFNMEIEAAREALLALPWVREVSLRREWPDRLMIKLREQQAVARWGDVNSASGSQYPKGTPSALLNEQGQSFAGLEQLTQVEGESLPELSGPEGYQQRVLAEYAALSETLGAYDLAVNSLALDARDAWRMSLSNGMQVLFLQRNKEAAMERLATVLSVFDEAKLQQARKVDLRYSNGFAIEWSKDVELSTTAESKTHV